MSNFFFGRCFRKSWLVYFTTILVLLLIAWGQGASKGSAAETHTILRVGMGALAPMFDPHMDNVGTSLPCYFAMYDSLTYIDENSVLKPALATEWKNVGLTTWRFKLRSGVRFHNGEEFTPYTVKYNIERVLNPETKAVVKARIPLVKGANVVDDSTVDIITTKPDPLLPKRMSVINMVPAKHVQAVGAERFATSEPAGTGPFKFKEWRRDRSITLVRSDNSWRGRPSLDEITMYALRDQGARLAALKSGDVDMIHQVPTDVVKDLEGAGLRVVHSWIGRMHAPSLVTTRDTPLKHKLVRQAINYAVDKDSLIEHIMGGFARRSEGQIVGPDGFGYSPNVKAYPYDPDKAKALLKEAGYPNGFSVDMVSAVGSVLNDKQTAEALVGYLGKVGIKVNYQPLETTVWIQHFYAGTFPPIAFTCLNYFPMMDADFYYSWYLSSARMNAYASKEFDNMYAAQSSEMDPVKRQRILWEMAAFFREEAPVLFLFQAADIYAVNKKVIGFKPRQDAVIWFDSIKIAR